MCHEEVKGDFIMAISAVTAASGSTAYLGPSLSNRLVWLTSSAISAVASAKLWRGFQQSAGTTVCGCCHTHLFGFAVAQAKAAPIFAVTTALFVGITAICLIQATRPSGFWFRKISEVS